HDGRRDLDRARPQPVRLRAQHGDDGVPAPRPLELSVELPTAVIDLSGRVALITGGGHGIGAETARLMAGLGAAGVVNDIDAARADETASTITDAGGRAVAAVADVSNPGDVERMVATARDAFDDPDILVNNAYFQCDKAFLEYTIDEWDRVYAVIVR